MKKKIKKVGKSSWVSRIGREEYIKLLENETKKFLASYRIEMIKSQNKHIIIESSASNKEKRAFKKKLIEKAIKPWVEYEERKVFERLDKLKNHKGKLEGNIKKDLKKLIKG